MRKHIFSSILRWTFVANVVGCLVTLPAYADLPMQVTQAEEYFGLVVPDQDTTVSAFGGELRRYDVHIAKMYEVTDHLCRKWNWKPTEYLHWGYSAGNGSIRMGRFKITCEAAFGAFQMIGKTGNPERTVIFRSSEGGVRDEIELMVPTLGLSDSASIRRWMRATTKSIKPL